MTDDSKQTITLDHNGQIPIRLIRSTGNGGGYDLAIDGSRVDSRRLFNQLQRGIALKVGSAVYTPKPDAIEISKPPHRLYWHIPCEEITNNAEILLQGEPICPLQLVSNNGDQEFALQPKRAHERLTLSEIKMLANADVVLKGIPFKRSAMAGFNPELHAPVTDLHTHSTAQIKARDLMQIAIEQDRHMDGSGITYPIELLQLLDVALSDEQRSKIITVPSIKFSPGLNEDKVLECEKDPQRGHTCQAIRLKDLTQEQRDVIVRKMDIEQQTIQPFSRFDPEMYRFRNPLAKRSELAREVILTIARDYKQQGIRYTELSTGSMLESASWMAEAIKAVEEAQEHYGVTVRFLAGVPRSSDASNMLRNLEKIKYAARHPYIVGVDVLGYEFNSTKDFAWALQHIAQWASSSEDTELKPEQGWNFQRDFTIRVHAGETGKRRENVVECAKIAKQYGVKVRIAHALSGSKLSGHDRKLIEDEIKKGHLMVELCPPSNLTYNNLSRVDDAPLREWAQVGMPSVLGTDGGGAIQVDATQLALDAIAAGWTLEDLKQLREREEDFIAQQCTNEAEKSRAFKALYGRDANTKFIDGYTGRLREISHHSIDKEFSGRLPFLIAGAGGSTYDELVPAKEHGELRKSIRVAFEMLRMACRRETNAFVLGRVKEEGVSGEMDRVLMTHRHRNPGYAFPVAGVYLDGTTEIAKSISYCEAMKGDESSIPYKLFERAIKLHPPALGIFISGSTFTNDMLRYYHADAPHEGGWPFVVMKNAPGASMNFAKGTTADRHFEDGITLLKAIDHQVRHTDVGKKLYGDILPFAPELYTNRDGVRELDEAKLAELKRQAEENITMRGHDGGMTPSRQGRAKG